MKILIHPKKYLLGFETYVAPENFDRKAQPVDIYEVFNLYYRNHRTAKWIYSVTDAATTTTPTNGTSYRYGYEIGGVKYQADLAMGGTITWDGSSTKRWVIVNHTTMAMMEAIVGIDKKVEWLYCGNWINSVRTSGTSGSASASSIKYIHIHRLSNVTTYGYCCHYGNSSLTGHLYLSDGATEIQALAFDSCTGLYGALIIPNSYIILGNECFGRCGSGFTSLTLGNSLREIRQWAFWATILGGEVIFPQSLELIGVEAFLGSTGLTGELRIPQYCVSIGSGAFGNTGFTSIVSEGSNFIVDDYTLYDIGTPGEVYAVHGVKGYTGTLTLRTGTTKILGYCFSANSRSGGVTIPDTVKVIEYYNFSQCPNLTGPLNLGSGSSVLESIGMRCFWYSKLTGPLAIPNSVKYIRYGAFSGFTAFTSLDLGTGVQVIEAPALTGATFTGALVIPASMGTLELGAIGSHNFSSITSGSTNYPAEDNVLYDCKTGGQVIAHIAAKAYSGTLTLKSNTTRIYNSCFNAHTGRTGTLTIPSTVSVINYQAFWGCSGFNRCDCYIAAALVPPNIDVDYSFGFGNSGIPLHITSGATGYNINPWTNTTKFSSITQSL